MRNVLIIIRQFTWELPQTLLGLIIILFNKIKSVGTYKDSKIYYLENKRFGISLGRYIIVTKNSSIKTIKHEYGHCIQSKYLGVLYLIVIGIPSISMNVISQIVGGQFAYDYYKRFPENWADKLGDVKDRE